MRVRFSLCLVESASWADYVVVVLRTYTVEVVGSSLASLQVRHVIEMFKWMKSVKNRWEFS